MLIEGTLAAQARAEKLPEKPEYAQQLQAEVTAHDRDDEDRRGREGRRGGVRGASARPSRRVRASSTPWTGRSTRPPSASWPRTSSSTSGRGRRRRREKLALEAKAKIEAGADFNKLAREISDDRSARNNFGKLDWFARGEMDPAFEKAAFALKNPATWPVPCSRRSAGT